MNDKPSSRFGAPPTVEDVKSTLTPEAEAAPKPARAPKPPKKEFQQPVAPTRPDEVVGKKKRKLKEFEPVDIPESVLAAWAVADADDPRPKRHINVKIDPGIYNEIEYCAMMLRMSLTDYVIYAHKMIAPKKKS